MPRLLICSMVFLETVNHLKSKRFACILLGSSVLLIASFISALLLGRFEVKIDALFGILLGNADYTIEKSIILNLRLPRTIIAGIVGASLSVSGLLYQETFRNKLVSPDLLGVSSGAGVGAALAIILGLPAFFISGFAFAFGLITVFATLFVAKVFKNNSSMILTLSGIIVGGLMSSVLSFVKYLADAETTLASITFWLMGSFENSVMSDVLYLLPITVICLIVTLLISYRINVVALGKEEAQTKGINYVLYRTLIILVATLLTASSVAFAGTISWIGLVIPHIVRLCVGRDTTKTIPLSITFGASFMIISDILSRTFTAAEVPISAVTGFFGTIVFIAIMYARRNALHEND